MRELKRRSKDMRWGLAGLIRSGGYTDHDLGKPIVEIVNTWSEWNPGHRHLRQMAEAVKRGVWMAGGFPLEYNTLSLCPGQTLPNRNLIALETQAVFLDEPADAAVFICSCDKDVPALLMGAARVNLPSIFVLGGAMLPGRWKGEDVVCCTDAQRILTELRAGNITEADWELFTQCVHPGCGACGPMGTANTMQSMAEALGMALPGSATTPAVSARLLQLAEESGRQVMELLKEDLKPTDIITPQAMDNAIKVLMAIGGSTNAVIHLIALAKHLDSELPLERFDQISRQVPYITDVRPSGRYVVADLWEVGGITAVMKRIEALLDTSVKTVTGRTLGENLAGVRVPETDMIRTLEDPLLDEGGLAVVKGTLAPKGAIIKHSGSRNRKLLQHKGPALVFNSALEARQMLAREDLEVREDHVLVLRYEGPKGDVMPERGALPIPIPLAKKGVKDMLVVNDCRMSGTNFGSIVLHSSPEAYVGGPLAAVENGDVIELDLAQRRLDLLVPEREIKRRLEGWTPPEPRYDYKRGPLALWYRFCEQADKGCVYPFM